MTDSSHSKVHRFLLSNTAPPSFFALLVGTFSYSWIVSEPAFESGRLLVALAPFLLFGTAAILVHRFVRRTSYGPVVRAAFVVLSLTMFLPLFLRNIGVLPAFSAWLASTAFQP